MSAAIDEFRLCKIVSSLIELTNSKASYKECVDLIYRIWARTPAWKRFITEKAVEMLVRSSQNPVRFQSIIDKLQAGRLSLLGPYLLLLYLAKFDPVPVTGIKLPTSPESCTENQLGILNDDDFPEVYIKLNSVKTEAFYGRRQLAVPGNPAEPEMSALDWSLVRPHLSLDFIDEYRFTPDHPVFTEGPAAQELQLVEDLLSCFLGFHGVYITANSLKNKYDRRTFMISDEIEPTFRGIVQRVLPLASDYSTIVRFVEENRKLEAGRVNQALASKMDDLLADFTALVAYIETRHKNRPVDLNSLWSEVRSSLEVMQPVTDVATAIMMTAARGGQTLSILHEAALSHIVDDTAHTTFISLLEMCAEPYFKSVSRWIYRGILHDPYDEFMITRNKLLEGTENSPSYPDEYWNKGFRVRPDCVPTFLEPVVDLIYEAGKYMDVVNKSVSLYKPYPFITEDELHYDLKESKYLRSIEKAHFLANKLIVKMMVEDYDILGRISCAKRYFVMEGGDLFANIMEHCEQELERPVGDICPVYLSSLLESALATSSSKVDAYSGDIGFILKKESLLTQIRRIAKSEFKHQSIGILSGLEAFTLTMKPQWPVNLVLNYKTITCGQMLFRLLFYSRYVERCLIQVKGKWKKGLLASALKHRMVCFIQGLHCYMAEDTIETQWYEFLHDMNNVSGIENMMKRFYSFLQFSMSGCMLTDDRVAKSYRQMLDVCFDYGLHLSIKLDPDVDYFDKLFTSRVVDFLTNCQRLPYTNAGHCATAIHLRVNYNNYYSVASDNHVGRLST